MKFDINAFFKGCAMLIGFYSIMYGISTPSFIFFILGIVLVYFSDVITGLIRDIQHQMEMVEIKKETERIKEIIDEEKEVKEVTRSYKNVKEMTDSFEERKTKLEKFIDKYAILWHIRRIFWSGLLDHPQDFQLEVKSAYERMRRGYSDRDVWGFDYYLSNVIIGGLERLKETKHGLPMECFKKTDPTNKHGGHTEEAFKMAEERWNRALDTIIETFKTSKKIQEDHWHYQNSKNYSIENANKYRKMNVKMLKEDPDLWGDNGLHVMTKSECKEYEKGWLLFQKHYYNLWD
ncbi:MAG: hypothetical protein DRO67_09070 [Candidatus Asgardarchaeum californiense]|nr:MAG: hypothetical protein DRO67_09070 [Candidatus Asgardarchaeum californiense]